MTGRQRPERSDEIADVLIGSTDADPSAELLQHIDARASVRRIHHEMHCAVRLEDVAQSCEPGIRVREMMENSGADDLIEARLQIVCTLDGQAGGPEDWLSCICA